MSLPYFTNPGVGYGSRIVTFSTGNSANVAFIAEEYSPSEPTAQTTRTTELGAPNGWIGFEERRTANWKLQVATNSTNYFDRGDECIVTRKTTGTNTINVTMVVVDMGLPERPRDFWSIDVQLLEKK